MAGERGRPSVWLLPKPTVDLPSIERGRPRLATSVSVVLLAAAIPAFVFLAPRSRWEPEDLLVLLVAFAYVSYAAATPIRGINTYDAGFVAALIALAFLGPVPAVVVLAGPVLAQWLGGLQTAKLFGNLVAHTWPVLLAALVLDAFASEVPLDFDQGDYAALATAGVVLVLSNWALGTLLVPVLHDGIRFRVELRAMLLSAIPIDLVLLGTGLLTVFLYDRLGVPGLAPLVLILLAPRLLARLFLRDRPASQLPRWAATAAYAEAIAEELGLDGSQRRVLADAATHLGGPASLTRQEDFTAVMQTVLHCHEHWDGEGGSPGIESGEQIPLESRILAVANAWSALTAEGTRELTPEQAATELRAHAGAEFDPAIIAAALKAQRDRTFSLAD